MNRCTAADAYSAKHSGQLAGQAFQTGHPVAGLAHLGYLAAKAGVKYGLKKYRDQYPYKCQQCGKRF